MKPLVEKKRAALIKHKKDPTAASRRELKNASSASRKAAREHADKYWQNLASDIQRSL